MDSINLEISPELEQTAAALRLRGLFRGGGELVLRLGADGLSLISEGNVLRGDFTKLVPRIRRERIGSELLVRAAKTKGQEGVPTVLDATAGLGEDSFLLAAAGFRVVLYEHNPVIYELLCDALRRAADAGLGETAARMEVQSGDSVEAMRTLSWVPDVILLDPMFPERQKSALVKKKLQMIQKLEIPCKDEREMFLAAVNARPRKLIVKRPPKGPHLAEIKPDYCIEGKAVRYDCFVSPFDKIHLYNQKL